MTSNFFDQHYLQQPEFAIIIDNMYEKKYWFTRISVSKCLNKLYFFTMYT